METENKSVRLKVCPECGWNIVPYSHVMNCDPIRGAAADVCIRVLSTRGFTVTKLGYGFGRIAVADGGPDDRSTLVFDVERDGRLRLAHAFLKPLNVDQVSAIMLAIGA